MNNNYDSHKKKGKKMKERKISQTLDILLNTVYKS